MIYTLTSHWLPASQYPLKAPYAMTPEGIVVHNTAGTASAREEAAAMIASTAATSFHVVIDEAEAVECIPFARNAWHAGDGAAGYANRHLIGLEIARSMDTATTRFAQAEANAALYIAHVCRQYGWTSAQLHQHNWYSSTACPHRTKTHWQTFLAQVDECLAELEGGGGASAGAQNEGAASAAGANNGDASEGGGSTAGANSGGAGDGGTSGGGSAGEGGGSTAGAGDGGMSGAGGASGGGGSTAGANSDAPTITILCDGQPLTLRGRNENGTIYTSLRDIATALGHTVRWENGMAVVEK
ncbi:MAG: N-acetylmuramoyl-L-alanine amidase [Peptococcaceae bacterium]|nr:N-acetylmuramoyl-L-alanine amidase [Peptococcaceae bacterium]